MEKPDFKYYNRIGRSALPILGGEGFLKSEISDLAKESMEYINRLEEINRQKQDLIEGLEINYNLKEVLIKGYIETIDKLKQENKISKGYIKRLEIKITRLKYESLPEWKKEE